MTGPERGGPAAASLLELLRQNYKTNETEDLSLWDEDASSGEKLPDGYVRLSPIQPYQDAPGAANRRPPTALILCALILGVAVLGFILWRSILH